MKFHLFDWPEFHFALPTFPPFPLSLSVSLSFSRVFSTFRVRHSRPSLFSTPFSLFSSLSLFFLVFSHNHVSRSRDRYSSDHERRKMAGTYRILVPYIRDGVNAANYPGQFTIFHRQTVMYEFRASFATISITGKYFGSIMADVYRLA